MAQIANFTVFDGASTPVSHTLVAVSVSKANGVITGLWREGNPALPAEAQVTVEMSLKQLVSGVWVGTQTTSVPVMESISGNNAAGYTAAPKVAYIDRYVTTAYAHPRSTIASRRLARQIHLNIGNNVSTSVEPSVTGFAPELFDQLLAAT